tara:strand:- start:617 stop:1129 length:513 start_codon:yes stop_codon:yes gene_type:complete
MNIQEIEAKINKIPDYPKPGILFYDISSLIINNTAFSETIRLLTETIKKFDFNCIAAIDARGFIFGSAIAHKLGLGLVMIRKKGKLPGKVMSHSYDLEYGTDTLEINVKAKNKKFILVDDLLATGGTAEAAIELIKKSGGTISCFLALIELKFLKGKEKIDVPVETLIHY